MTAPDLPSGEEMLKLAEDLRLISTWPDLPNGDSAKVALVRASYTLRALASSDAKAGGLDLRGQIEALLLRHATAISDGHVGEAADAILSLDLLAGRYAEGERAMREKAAEVADGVENVCLVRSHDAEKPVLRQASASQAFTASVIACDIRAIPIADPSPPPAEDVEGAVRADGGWLPIGDEARSGEPILALNEHLRQIQHVRFLPPDPQADDVLMEAGGWIDAITGSAGYWNPNYFSLYQPMPSLPWRHTPLARTAPAKEER